MATAQGRRKHGTCFLRIREHCPFRKLRKNKCYDIENVPAKQIGERWDHFSDHPTLNLPQADSGISVVCLEPHAQVTIHSPACSLNQSLEQPMDTDTARLPPSQVGPSDACPSSSLAPAATFHHPQNTSPFNIDTRMELDSAVDPETGESAKG